MTDDESRFCNACGAAVRRTDKFCWSCGGQVAAPVQRAPTADASVRGTIVSTTSTPKARSSWWSAAATPARLVLGAVGILVGATVVWTVFAFRTGSDDRGPSRNTERAKDTYTIVDVQFSVAPYGPDCTWVQLEAGRFAYTSMEVRISDGAGTVIGTAQPTLGGRRENRCLLDYEIDVPRVEIYQLTLNHTSVVETRTLGQLESQGWSWNGP